MKNNSYDFGTAKVLISLLVFVFMFIIGALGIKYILEIWMTIMIPGVVLTVILAPLM